MQITSLVTGGAGFIGSHVVHHLIEAGQRVVILDDLSGGTHQNLVKEAVFVKGDITDSILVNKLFETYRFDYVYHLAAYAAEGLSHFIRRFNYTNNLIGSINLINASVNHKVKCFVYTSSIAVYGANELPLTEVQVPAPEDPYGIAKYAVEMDLKNAYDLFDLEYVIFRPHNVYGPGQNIGDKYRNVVGIFMNQILKGEPLTIFGDGNQTRAFSYIDDVAPYIANAINIPEARNNVFNVGGEMPYTVNQLATKIMEVMKAETEVDYLQKRHEVEHAYADHNAFKRVFNPKPPVDLITGLREMAAWVMKNGALESQYFEDIEITKKLPPSWQ